MAPIDFASADFDDIESDPVLYDFAIPLLHPTLSREFVWAGRVYTLHAQSRLPRGQEIDVHWFYIRTPEGTFHEVQYTRLRRLLEHPPRVADVKIIALALEQQSFQTPDSMTHLLTYCGLVAA